MKLVVFGHIHEGYGIQDLPFDTVQKLHEGLLLGSKGLSSLIYLAILILVGKMTTLFRPPPMPDGGQHSVKFVNAAITKGPRNEESRLPMVVDI